MQSVALNTPANKLNQSVERIAELLSLKEDAETYNQRASFRPVYYAIVDTSGNRFSTGQARNDTADQCILNNFPRSVVLQIDLTDNPDLDELRLTFTQMLESRRIEAAVLVDKNSIWVRANLKADDTHRILSSRIHDSAMLLFEGPCYCAYGVFPDDLIDPSVNSFIERISAGKIAACLLKASDPIRVDNRKEEIVSIFRSAYAENRINVKLQPVVDLKTGRVSGHEILSRIVLSGHELPTDAWIGTIMTVSDCHRLATLVIDQFKNLIAKKPCISGYVSINLNPIDLAHDEVFNSLMTLSPAMAERLVVEITEWSDFADFTDLSTRVKSLKKKGIRIAIDDFGSGYSSFRAVRLIEHDLVKIDKEFIQSKNLTDHKVVQALVDLSREYGSKVIAEGIEHQGHASFVRKLGINFGQGWLYGMPKPIIKDCECLNFAKNCYQQMPAHSPS